MSTHICEQTLQREQLLAKAGSDHLRAGDKSIARHLRLRTDKSGDHQLCALTRKTARRKRNSRERRRAGADLDSAPGERRRDNGKIEKVRWTNAAWPPGSTRRTRVYLRSACCERRELRNRPGLRRRRRFGSALVNLKSGDDANAAPNHRCVTGSSSFIRHGEILPKRSRVAPAMPSAFETPLSMREPPVLSHSFFPISATFSRTIRPRW